MIVTARLQARLHAQHLAARISRVPITAALGTGLRATLDPLSVDIPLPLAATPVFAPGAGSFYLSQLITLSSATPSAAIYYTTNGTEPTDASPLYTSPFTLPAGTYTLKARAYAPGYSPSEVASAAYELLPYKLLRPGINISTDDPITPSSTHSIISIFLEGLAFYFTTDGSEPTEDSTLYTVPFALPAGTYTIKARAYAPGYSPSDVAVSPEFTVQQSLPTEGGILHNGYYYHIFEADGELEVLADVDVEYLIVGGGGSGGANNSNVMGGGGGGAGGVIHGEASLSSGTYDIVVGAGGIYPGSANDGQYGGYSAIVGLLTAYGGGGGAFGGDALAENSGGRPYYGSGGGCGGGTTNERYGARVSQGQGYRGADKTGSSDVRCGGGGGGFTSTGLDYTEYTASHGGAGIALAAIWEAGISAALSIPEEYGGGGGGGGYKSTTNRMGGDASHGGGHGGGYILRTNTLYPAESGDENTGGGGGGQQGGDVAAAGNGGSGIVIVRYAV